MTNGGLMTAAAIMLWAILTRTATPVHMHFYRECVHHLCASSTTSYTARWYLLKVPLTGQVRDTSLQ